MFDEPTDCDVFFGLYGRTFAGTSEELAYVENDLLTNYAALTLLSFPSATTLGKLTLTLDGK